MSGSPYWFNVVFALGDAATTKQKNMKLSIEELNMLRSRLKHIATTRPGGTRNPWKRIALKVGCHPHNVKIFLDKGVKYPKIQHQKMIAEANKIIEEYFRKPKDDETD